MVSYMFRGPILLFDEFAIMSNNTPLILTNAHVAVRMYIHDKCANSPHYFVLLYVLH
jgi:hypothetical protein